MAGVVFRPAQLADIDTLTPFIRELYGQDHIVFALPRVRHALSRLIDDPLFGRAWVIEHESDPVGYLLVTFGYSVEFGGRDAFVDELFVHASHRGRGIGSQALRVAEECCRELGIGALHLEVERDNAAAQRLYRAKGFVDHERYLMTRRIELPDPR